MAITDIIYSQLLCCGSLDIDFIEQLEEEFSEWEDWDNLRKRIIEDDITANDIISEIYYNALDKACKGLGIQIYNVNYNIFANCLDSSIYIKDCDGFGERMYNKSEIADFLLRNYTDWQDKATDYLIERTEADSELIIEWVTDNWELHDSNENNLEAFEDYLNEQN